MYNRLTKSHDPLRMIQGLHLLEQNLGGFGFRVNLDSQWHNKSLVYLRQFELFWARLLIKRVYVLGDRVQCLGVRCSGLSVQCGTCISTQVVERV